eukprot:5758713-Alexandrium_andersonii.AAC.1
MTRTSEMTAAAHQRPLAVPAEQRLLHLLEDELLGVLVRLRRGREEDPRACPPLLRRRIGCPDCARPPSAGG